MKSNLNVVQTLLLTASLVGITHGGVASAASACKGLENSACNASSNCNWVAGYERKDGRTVKPFCRTKPSAKKASVKNGQQKSAGKKGNAG